MLATQGFANTADTWTITADGGVTLTPLDPILAEDG